MHEEDDGDVDDQDEDEDEDEDDDDGALTQAKLSLVGASFSWCRGSSVLPRWWCITPAKPPLAGVRGPQWLRQ